MASYACYSAIGKTANEQPCAGSWLTSARLPRKKTSTRLIALQTARCSPGPSALAHVAYLATTHVHVTYIAAAPVHVATGGDWPVRSVRPGLRRCPSIPENMTGWSDQFFMDHREPVQKVAR